MAAKTKNGKKPASSDKEDTKPWPDVPKQLLRIVARQSSLMNNFSFNGGITKSWRVVPSPKQCNPSGKSPVLPQLADVTDSGGRSSKPTTAKFLINVVFGESKFYFGDRRQRYRRNCPFHIKGFSQGALVGTQDETASKFNPSEFYMFDTINRVMWDLPCWDKDVPFKYVSISSSRSPFNICLVIIVVTGISKPAFLFAGLSEGCYRWVKRDCTVSDPYSSNNQLMQFTSVISFQGKFYALSLQGTLAVLEVNSDYEPRITALGRNRAVPGVHSKYFRECLIQSNGEILLVFLISMKSIKIVDYIEVYRLEFDRLLWEKLQELGDRTLFMGANCCVSVTSSSVGCRSNCVYFSQEEEEEEGGWWVFDMDTKTITPGWNTIIGSATKSPTWNEPALETPRPPHLVEMPSALKQSLFQLGKNRHWKMM